MAKYMMLIGGKVYYQEGDDYASAYQKASSKYATDLSLDMASGKSSSGIGMAAAGLAIDMIGSAVGKKIDKAHDFEYQGDAMFHEGDFDGAIKMFDKAAETHLGASGGAIAKKGYIYFKQGKNNEALECYAKAIKKAFPKRAHIYRSELYASIGDKEKALLDCCDAINGDYDGTFSRWVVEDKGKPSVERTYKDYIDEYGMDISGFEKRCFPLFKEAAESGNARAYAGLAECYDQGYGVEKNEAEAMKWFEKAEKAGYLNGMLKMKKNIKYLARFKMYKDFHKIAAVVLAIVIGIPTIGIGLIPGFIVGRIFGRKIRRKIWPCSSGVPL